jgi:WD40 repeat protein
LLKFSPDGKLLVLQVLEADKPLTTQIWDIAAFQKRRTLGGPKRELDAVSFAPDGKRLLGRDGGKLFLWDVDSGAEIDTGEQLRVPRARGLAFAPDGKTVAVGSSVGDGWTRFLDAANLKEKKWPKGSSAIKHICEDRLIFSPNGRFLAGSTESDRGRIFIWDRTGEKETQRLPGWNVFAFSPHGKTLVYGLHEFGKQLGLWDAALGRPMLDRPGHDKTVAALAVSSDGCFIVSDADDGLYLWDAASGKSLRKWEGFRERHACLFSPDGKRLIRFAGEDAIQVLDLAAGKELRRFHIDSAPHEREPCQVLGLSADGKCLTVVVTVGKTSAKMYIWDLVAGKELRQVPYKLEERITSLSRGRRELRGFAHAALSPDAEVVSVWRNGRVGLEEVASGRLLAMLPARVGWPLVFSPDGQLVAAAILQPKPDPADGEDRQGVALIEAATGEEIFRLQIDAFDRIAFTPDGRGLVVADGKYLRVWDSNSGERLHRMPWPDSLRDHYWHEVRTCSLAVLPGGRAVTGATEGDILVWDLSAETWPSRPPSRDLDRKQLDALWIDLLGQQL